MKTLLIAICLITVSLDALGQVLLYDAVLQGASFNAGSTGGGSGGGSTNPISVVQVGETNYGATYVTAITATFTNAVTEGSCLVAAVNLAYPGGLPTAMTDSMTNTWTMVTNAAWSGGVCLMVTYVATNAHAGATTVTCTPYQSAPYCQIIVAEYTNVAKASPVDAYNVTSGTGGAAPATLTTPSVTASTTNGVAVGMFFASTGPLAAGAGYTLDKYASAGLVEHQVMSATGAITATCTNSTSSDAYAAGIMVLKHQ